MNASFLYVLRNLGRCRARTVVGVLGVFLTLALLTTVQIGIDSISTSYIELVALQAGKADIVITKKGGNMFEPLLFDPREVQSRLESNPRLRGLSPRFLGLTQVSSQGGEHYAVLIGVDPKREHELDIWGIVPEPVLREKTCAISKALADKLKAKSGSTIFVRAANGYSTMDLSLETVMERQLLVPQQVPDFIVINQSSARELLGQQDEVHMLAGAFENPQSYYDARDLHGSVLRIKDAGTSISAELGMDYDVRLPKAAAITGFQHFTSPLRAFFGVLALLALTIIGLLIYSLISVSVEERIREYAILRTLGARRADIFKLVLGESALLCFLGVVPGVLAGALAAKIGVKLIALAMGAKGALASVSISPNTLFLTVAGGALLSIGSALIPALSATRWRIADALDPMRRGLIPPEVPEANQASRPLVLAGLALSAISVVVFFVLPNAFVSGNPSLIGSVILCLLLSILLGFTLAMVGTLPFLQQLLMRMLGRAFGPAAELAKRNLERHRRRHGTTALLFTLSVSMVIFIASLVALFSRTALSLVEHIYGADIRIHAGQSGSESLKGDLSRVEGVQTVSEVQFLRNRSEQGVAYEAVISDLVGMKHLWIVPFGVDTDLNKVLYTNQVLYESGPSTVLPELAQVRLSEAQSNAVPAIVLSTAIAKFLDVNVGTQVQLTFLLGSEKKEARFRVAAICNAMPGFENFRSRVAYATGAGALISLENFQILTRTAPSEAFQAMYFLRTPGEASAQKTVAKRIRDEFDARYRFGVQSTAEQKQEMLALYWVTQVLFGLLLAVAVVIAVFALIASMASTVLERHREVGVLKALGLRRRELFRMFLGEAVVLTLSAGIGGGAIGFLLAWLFILQGTALMEMPSTFTMPYLTFVATLLISLFAGALAAHLPTRNLLRKTAGEILRM